MLQKNNTEELYYISVAFAVVTGISIGMYTHFFYMLFMCSLMTMCIGILQKFCE